MLTVVEEAHKTDTGRQRQANEDSYFAREPVFAVADGMGGAQAGEVASRIAAATFEPFMSGTGSPETELRELISAANRKIHELAQKDSARAGMGTTLTAALVGEEEVSFGHVGDSRAYVLRGGELTRLTKDHSLVEELRRQGRLTEQEAEEHPQRSIITRALGPEPEVEVDTMTYPARDGDVFLICSDGLTTMVPEEEIRKVLERAKSLRTAVSRLIEAANAAGGRDNITAVAFRIGQEGAEEPDEGATFIDRTADHVSLGAEQVRATADRLGGRSPMPDPRRRRVAKAVVALLAAGLLTFGATSFARSIYFLGTDDAGRVALYRGLPYDLPLGISLYSEQRAIPVLASSLSPARREVVTEHRLRDRTDAEDILTDIANREGSRPATGDGATRRRPDGDSAGREGGTATEATRTSTAPASPGP